MYKNHIYNLFLRVINRLYPSTLFESVSLGNVKFLMLYFFICLKYIRYTFKKQVVLFLEQYSNDINTRYRSLIIINLLKVLK